MKETSSTWPKERKAGAIKHRDCITVLPRTNRARRRLCREFTLARPQEEIVPGCYRINGLERLGQIFFELGAQINEREI